MKPSNSQTQMENQEKIEQLYKEIISCSKNSKKQDGKNFSSIKIKFWRLVNRLEKLLATDGTLTAAERIKLSAAKRKFK